MNSKLILTLALSALFLSTNAYTSAANDDALEIAQLKVRGLEADAVGYAQRLLHRETSKVEVATRAVDDLDATAAMFRAGNMQVVPYTGMNSTLELMMRYLGRPLVAAAQYVFSFFG